MPPAESLLSCVGALGNEGSGAMSMGVTLLVMGGVGGGRPRALRYAL